MPERPPWLEFLRRSQEAAPKWPQWIHWLAGALALLFVAFALGLLGNRPYIVFAGFWFLFAICLLNIRKAAPQYPEFGIFVGWFILAVLGALIAYMTVAAQS